MRAARVAVALLASPALLATACRHGRVVDRVENPTRGEKPLDLIAHDTEDNGLPLAPRWKYQWDGLGFPDATALCSDGSGTDHIDLPRCTSQKPVLDVATGFADAICTFGTRQDIHGHANWWPVTYWGRLYFDEAAIDGDFTFALVPDGEGALVTRNGGALHVEFDSREIVGGFDTPWWNDLRAAVARGQTDARQAVSGQPAVLTGLFGLDCEHHCHAESHPLYVFALRTNDGEGDETWAFFLRNWGNEGFCSQYVHVLPVKTVAFRIPWRCGAKGVALASGTVVRKSVGVREDLDVAWAPGEGVRVSIALPSAEDGAREGVHGELHLAWTMGAPCEQLAPAAPSVAPRFESEQEEDSPEKRLERTGRGAARRRAAPAAAPPAHVASTPKLHRVDHLEKPAPVTAKAKARPAKDKLQRDEAAMREACEAERKPGVKPPGWCEKMLRK